MTVLVEYVCREMWRMMGDADDDGEITDAEIDAPEPQLVLVLEAVRNGREVPAEARRGGREGEDAFAAQFISARTHALVPARGLHRARPARVPQPARAPRAGTAH